MTNPEFSNEFDVLVNSYNHFGEGSILQFDEYEKSKFLTAAQEQIILEYYSGKNPFREGFEKTEEIRRYLTSLIKTYKTSTLEISVNDHISNNSVFYKLPVDNSTPAKPLTWFITYEAIEVDDSAVDPCMRGEVLTVVPVRQDEYSRTKDNPFRGPNKRRALRLDVADNMVEIISKYPIKTYILRYLCKPSPIILVDLTNDGLTINGVSEETPCALNSVTHRTILDRAVRLAL